MIQFKRHFRNAIWFSVGITLGGLILPQVVFSGPSTSDQPFHIQAAHLFGGILCLCLPVFLRYGLVPFQREKIAASRKRSRPQILGGGIF